jgi:undecaprenyl-diphosphatase
MNELQALLLGVVQGLTEFLPISSSGHLILVPWVLDFHYLEQHPDFNKTFDVALHLGTLVAVLTYFRHDLLRYARGVVRSLRRRSVEGPDERLGWLIVIATIPAAAIGAVAEQPITDKLGQPWQIAILLAVFAILLYLADRLPERREVEELGLRDAILVGVAQAVALAPGTSRSGITITAGRALGLTRAGAARFSFLLLTPITLGALVYESADALTTGLPEGSLGPIVVGVLASAVSGFAAIWGMLRYLQTHSYDIFVWYRLAVAAVVLLLIATGIEPSTFE